MDVDVRTVGLLIKDIIPVPGGERGSDPPGADTVGSVDHTDLVGLDVADQAHQGTDWGHVGGVQPVSSASTPRSAASSTSPMPSTRSTPHPAGDQGPRPVALKCVYMAITSLDPAGKGQTRWTMRWETALNAFDIAFDGRLLRSTPVTPTTPVTPLI
jgi:hypothetical protein